MNYDMALTSSHGPTQHTITIEALAAETSELKERLSTLTALHAKAIGALTNATINTPDKPRTDKFFYRPNSYATVTVASNRARGWTTHTDE